MKLICVALTFAFSTAAFAQDAYSPPPPPPPQGNGGYTTPQQGTYNQPRQPPRRRADPYANNIGFTMGLALGPAFATCEGCDSENGIGAEFDLGLYINRRMQLMLDFSLWSKTDGFSTFGLSTSSIALKYYMGPRIWLKGGVGFATAQVDDGFFIYEDTGLGLTGQVGLDLVRAGGFAVDLSGRISSLSFGEEQFTTAAATIGIRFAPGRLFRGFVVGI